MQLHISCQKYKSTKTKPVNMKISKLNRENTILFGPVLKPKRKQKLKSVTASGSNNDEKRDSKNRRKFGEPSTTDNDIETDADLSCIQKSASVIPRLSGITKDNFSSNEDMVSWWNQDAPKKRRTKIAQNSDVSQIKTMQHSEFSRGPNIVPRLSTIGKSELTPNSFTEFLDDKLTDNGDNLDIKPIPVIPDSLAYVTKCPLSATTDESEMFLQFKSYVESLALRKLPTVNTIIQKTQADMSKFFLQRWRDKMIDELGDEGFKQYQESRYFVK